MDTTVDILMYHSISDSAGATSISPSVFEDQMAAIAESGIPVVSMDQYLSARQGAASIGERAIVITFDDGFLDFSEIAVPILQMHGFSSLVYLATDFIGQTEGWQGSNIPPRPILSWDALRDLNQSGVDFGSHSVSHADLNTLAADALDAELTVSKLEIEERLSEPCVHFAPPYGRANAQVLDVVARHYSTSVGTKLNRALSGANLYNLPRLEMYYFTDPTRWRNHLDGRGASYLSMRRAFRKIRGSFFA